MQVGINYGRGIKKHPKSIYIYVPIRKKAQNEIEGQQKLDSHIHNERKQDGTTEIIDDLSFRRRVIFDIEDTYVLKNSKKIPILENQLDGNSTERLYEILHKISKYPIIEEKETGGVKGYFSKDKGKIVIKMDLPQDEKTSVLIHEMCHSLYDDFNYKTERGKSEIFVESVAFLVADYFEFDTGSCSFGYITSWAKDNITEVMQIGAKIQKAANEFIELIKQYQNEQLEISA